MNIALMCHNRKQELMVQFCTAYCGILSKHTVCATNATGADGGRGHRPAGQPVPVPRARRHRADRSADHL